jgi:hypothetical protein
VNTPFLGLIARTVQVQLGALLVLACLALPPPQPAIAQQSTSPSAEELWKSYPLEQTPRRDVASPAVSPPANTATPGRSTGKSPGGSGRAAPSALLALFGFIAALGALALPVFRRRRKIQSQAQVEPLAFKLGSHENGSQHSHTASAQATTSASQPDPDVSGSAAAAPPDPHHAWIAAIEWRDSDSGSHFCVVARAARGDPGTVLTKSGPLEWPPTTAASVKALGAAAEKLEASLAAAGWEALPSGSEWYAKRFFWKPVVEDPTGSPAAPQRGSSRFAPRAPGPEDTKSRRCEIEWEAGSVASRFRASVYGPGYRRRGKGNGRVLGLRVAPRR